jgi:hypothetical protein
VRMRHDLGDIVPPNRSGECRCRNRSGRPVYSASWLAYFLAQN